MEIRQYTWEIVDANTWLIIEGDKGLLIDAVDNQDLYEALVALDSITVILTHSHFDHISGLNKIREIKPDAKVICTHNCSSYLGNIYRNMSAVATAFMQFYEKGEKGDISIEPFTCACADESFLDNRDFKWYGHDVHLEAFHGHTDDSLVAVFDNKYMFSGDTILSTATVTRFPRGSTKQFWEDDIPRLEELVSSISVVFPGHGEAGKLDEMISNNKALCPLGKI